MKIKQTAGRDALGDFAPKFAQLNDDVLFGEVWSREGELSLRDRSIVTVVALMAQGLTDSSFQYHLMSAKNNGVTRTEIAEILTHGRFTQDGPRRGRPFAWRRRSGRIAMLLMQELSIKTRWPFPSVPPTTHLRSTLSGKATSRPFPPSRSASTT